MYKLFIDLLNLVDEVINTTETHRQVSRLNPNERVYPYNFVIVKALQMHADNYKFKVEYVPSQFYYIHLKRVNFPIFTKISQIKYDTKLYFL